VVSILFVSSLVSFYWLFPSDCSPPI